MVAYCSLSPQPSASINPQPHNPTTSQPRLLPSFSHLACKATLGCKVTLGTHPVLCFSYSASSSSEASIHLHWMHFVVTIGSVTVLKPCVSGRTTGLRMHDQCPAHNWLEFVPDEYCCFSVCCLCGCAHACGGWRSTLSAFHLALPLDCETGSLTELERPGLAKLIASEPQGSSCLCLP